MKIQSPVTSTIPLSEADRAFLREMIVALEALPERELIPFALDDGDNVCALGAVYRLRGVAICDASGRMREISDALDMSPALAERIATVNNNQGHHEAPVMRWDRMHRWATALLGGAP